MPAPYTGGCQCGLVRYVLTAEPIRLVACHCKECQRQSGSAFGMSMLVKQDSLTVEATAAGFFDGSGLRVFADLSLPRVAT